MKPVRTRFAPSPTGLLHVGGVRTALFAWLIARQTAGKFILRIEDTDKTREVGGAEQHIIDSLHALGLNPDEGPSIGGQHGPYRQSERLDLYKQWAQKLIDNGRAYTDPYTSEEVQIFREQAQKDKRAFKFRLHRPENPKHWDGSTPLRFKSSDKSFGYRDEVMGDITSHPDATDDFILIKSDGYPTYNFAHIVDDAEMNITHIIRGQEFLSSMPNYLDLYEALGVTPPIIATVPHIMNEHGNKKLSKRDGAKDVLEYIKEGYLPDALVSFIATLGWNDGTTQEVFTREELIEKFDLSRVQKSGAHFDEKRLLWANGHFIREMPTEDLYRLVDSYWPETAKSSDTSYKTSVLALVQERLKFFSELPELTDYFFHDLPVNSDLIENNKQIKKYEKTELSKWLEQSKEKLELSDWNTENLQTTLNQLLEETGQKPGVLFSLIRIATTQSPSSPGLAETMAVLGKDTCLRRINEQLAHL